MFTEAQAKELLADWPISIDDDDYVLLESHGSFQVYDTNRRIDIGSGATAEDAVANSYRLRV